MASFFRNKQQRVLDASLSDTYTREEVLGILGHEFAIPADRLDVSLVRECLLALNPDALKISETQKEATLRRIRASIRKQQASRLPKKRLTLVFCVILLLILATVAIALVLRGQSLTFIQDVLGMRPPAITENAQSLVQYDLAHAEFAHSIIDVREAVYDGHQLRIVYAVSNKDGTELTDEDKYPHAIISTARQDGLHGADCIYVDGQSFNILDVYEKPGEMPGEMLYYLSANLEAQGYVPERTMMVGLPLAGDSVIIGAAATPPDMTREEYVASQTVPSALAFPVRVDLGSDALRLAVSTDVQTQADMALVLESAEFTPLEAVVQLTMRSDSAQYDETAFKIIAYRWAYAKLYSTDGKQVGEYVDARFVGGITNEVCIQLIFYPLVGWPEEMVLAASDKYGQPIQGEKISLLLQ